MSVTLAVTYAVQPGYAGTIVNVVNAQSPTVPDPLPDSDTSTVATPAGAPPRSFRFRSTRAGCCR